MENNWNIIFYKWEDWNIKINAIFEGETIWLSQKQMADVFWIDRSWISRHLKNIFEEWELEEKVVCADFTHTTDHGAIDWKTQKSSTVIYNLDAILSVWYRVNSAKATQFRIWANNVLKEYIIKGFAMDDERLKNGDHFWKDYFDQLLARIREIRVSERRFYQKITDIYATSNDYNSDATISRDFFAEVQNKFLYAICGKTSGELKYSRVNSEKPNMWLMNWKWQNTWWKIVKTDIVVWKNYLNEEEIWTLNLLVSWYLDFAELQAKKWKVMNMKDWINKTSKFLELNDMSILEWKWKISKKQADEKVWNEYEKFRVQQDKKYLSDFDKFVWQINNLDQ